MGQLLVADESGTGVLGFVPGVDRQNDQAGGAVLARDATQVRSLRTTAASPDGPEGEEDGLAPKLAEAHLVAVQCGKREVRRRLMAKGCEGARGRAPDGPEKRQ